MLTIAQAYSQFLEFAADMDSSDTVALCEAWNDYTDLLCKDGELTGLQSHYCPAFDETMPDDDMESDLEMILNDMRVTLSAKHIAKRTDGLGDFGPDARHWLCQIERGNRHGFSVEFSQGSAHTSAPTLLDVLSCCLSDLVDESEFTESGFEYWCDEYGFETDSRKAESTYRACIEQSKAMRDTFTASEIDDLREMFSEAGL